MKQWRKRMEQQLEALELRLGLRTVLQGTQLSATALQTAKSAGERMLGALPIYGQMPHIDLSSNELQLSTALTDKCKPTLVYQGEAQVSLEEYAECMGLSKSKSMDHESHCFKQLLLERSVLLKGLRPACDIKELDRGDALIMRGGVVHARPM